MKKYSNTYLREMLAEKVILNEKLLKRDRQEIYRLLTGDEPPVTKRGRPSKEVRDYRMAKTYLTKKRNGEKPNKIRKYIVDLYKIESSSNLCNTYHSAISRGIKIMEKRANEWLNKVNSGDISGYSKDEIDEKTLIATDNLELIANYRKDKIT